MMHIGGSSPFNKKVQAMKECPEFIEMRETHITAQSWHVLLQGIPPEKIFNFFFFYNKFEIIFGCVCVLLTF